MKNVEGGVMVQDEIMSLFMYADDIVLLSGNTEKAQWQLDIMSEWCSQWGMLINA